MQRIKWKGEEPGAEKGATQQPWYYGPLRSILWAGPLPEPIASRCFFTLPLKIQGSCHSPTSACWQGPPFSHFNGVTVKKNTTPVTVTSNEMVDYLEYASKGRGVPGYRAHHQQEEEGKRERLVLEQPTHTCRQDVGCRQIA